MKEKMKKWLKEEHDETTIGNDGRITNHHYTNGEALICDIIVAAITIIAIVILFNLFK